MAYINDIVLDSGITILDTQATSIHVTTVEASGSYAQASSTYSLGYKHGITISAPADRTGGGRKVSVSSVSDGVIASGGTATYWAIVDSGNSRVLATGPLNSQVVTAGNTFSLSTFDIGIPDAV